MEYCIICNSEIQSPKLKYCSNKCKQRSHYNRHHKNNPNTSYSQYKRGDERKRQLIALKGGACSKCGYSSNLAALVFHHTCCKSFPLDARNLGNRSMEIILKEAEKCILLCMNCHMEEHYPDYTLN